MTRTAQLLAWFSDQTRIVRCFSIAILLHAILIGVLGGIKLVSVLKITPPSGSFRAGSIVDSPEQPAGEGGNDQPVPAQTPNLIPTGPIKAARAQPAPSSLTSPIGIESPIGRLIGDGPLVKLDPQPAMTIAPNLG